MIGLFSRVQSYASTQALLDLIFDEGFGILSSMYNQLYYLF
jgi:hypothetical protein